jgi:hypothetical protein
MVFSKLNCNPAGAIGSPRSTSPRSSSTAAATRSSPSATARRSRARFPGRGGSSSRRPPLPSPMRRPAMSPRRCSRSGRGPRVPRGRGIRAAVGVGGSTGLARPQQMTAGVYRTTARGAHDNVPGVSPTCMHNRGHRPEVPYRHSSSREHGCACDLAACALFGARRVDDHGRTAPITRAASTQAIPSPNNPCVGTSSGSSAGDHVVRPVSGRELRGGPG